MSARAARLATRDILKTALSLNTDQCEVMPDGKPKPDAGELFVAVHPGYWHARDIEGLEEEFGVRVTVTMRLGAVPLDRAGPSAQDLLDAGLDAKCRQVMKALHLDVSGDAWLNAVNAYISADTPNAPATGFVEPLRFRDGGTSEERGAEWFWAEDAEHSDPPSGLSQTMQFGGAVRVQSIETMQ